MGQKPSGDPDVIFRVSGCFQGDMPAGGKLECLPDFGHGALAQQFNLKVGLFSVHVGPIGRNPLET